MDALLTVAQIITSLGTIIAIFTLVHQIKQEKDEKKWRQATKISTWVDEDSILTKFDDTVYDENIIISNDSEQPIYDAVLSIDSVEELSSELQNDDSYIYYIKCIPPGLYVLYAKGYGKGMCKQYNSSICFRDVKGNYWSRSAAGILTEISNSIDYRKLSRPVISEQIHKLNR